MRQPAWVPTAYSLFFIRERFFGFGVFFQLWRDPETLVEIKLHMDLGAQALMQV